MKIRYGLLQFACLCTLSAAVAAQGRIPPVQVSPPGETGRRIADDGLLANYFPASRRGPAVLVLGGSAGALAPEPNRVAIALQASGFSALHLSYFRAPGQNPRAELIPLEYFSNALTWLRRQPEVDPGRMGIVGASKGAEAALLIAARDPAVKAVVAALPSSVVWPGIVWEGSAAGVGSSWTERGAPVAHLPHVPYDASKGMTMADNFAASLKSVAQHPEAVIPVEKIRASLLLVCAEADQVSPSCPMARQIEQRLREHGRPAPILLAYKDAGHAAFGLPMAEGDPRLAGGAGTPEATNAARADSWAKALAFLNTHLAVQNSGPVRTVPFVDLDRYVGDWFEIARFPNRFQKRCLGDVRASYTRRADGRIDVLNQCRTDEGPIQASGIARVVDDRTFARLKVRFAPAWLSWLPPVWGDYWVIGLAEDYSWAVVGSPDRKYLWILARTPRLDAASAAAARDIARANGFAVERLVEGAHGDGRP